ncbi:GNAT family N-acetyltransferase [Pedobacter africanus]|uniref:Acetyltransferase (GNAT) domain-containing protein n=1 Tax=Pedobacter africanus TaxID=151894 RepID=A0A1W2B6V1_9SPHI|nr:GNAT family N-acetyltransferase [Pedobacter africanus]SMC68659.1 Acetyltransferase (GNAT) domain-containing protein [Pedobacter africanus]
MEILKYKPLFKEKCVALFESNMPRFFAPEELPLFVDFLDNDIEDNYYVVEKNRKIVACGGIFLDTETDEAGLSWGMVHIAEHKNGIGKLLTEYRINLLKEIYPGKIYKIDTSQHTEGFYLKRGFRTIAVVPDGFAKGIDKYVMKMS